MADPDPLEPDAYRAQIQSALRAARRVWWAAMISFWAGVAFVVISVVRYLIGDLALEDAANFVVVLGIAGMASGVAFYATSWNMRIGVARLKRQLEV